MTRADVPFPPFPTNFSCYKETEEELLVPPGRQPWRCTMVSASVAGPARFCLGMSSEPGKSGPTPAGPRHSAGSQSPAAPQPCQPRPRLCPSGPRPHMQGCVLFLTPSSNVTEMSSDQEKCSPNNSASTGASVLAPTLPPHFLYFFALIAEEGFLISSCYSLEFCIQMFISFLFSFAFHFSSSHSYL